MSPRPEPATATDAAGRLTGFVLLAVTLFVILAEWTDEGIWRYLAAGGVILFLIAATPRVAWSRVVFVVAAVILVICAVLTNPAWPAMILAALKSAAFIAAFFAALTCLRFASASSPAIEQCGHFLAEQPPGRRYLALTVGGHLFALILNYGSISLLGNLAAASARREANEEIRTHRVRRMLLAIQRGFVSTLPWSPLTFAVAISTSLVPGAKWADALGYCVVTALILAGLGWVLDTLFKPRLSVPVPQRAKTEWTWSSLTPLFALLALLVVSVGGLHLITGIRAVAVVMVVVPLISVCWIALQNRGNAPLQKTRAAIAGYLFHDLPGYCGELVLLTMAGFIGTLGAKLVAPVVASSGFDLASYPGWLVLVTIVWLIPLAGQLGMNPILSVSLIAPLLPHASALGVTPAAVITALTAGWALSGASSPYTATTLLVGNIAGVSAWRVGLGWNGAYTLLCLLVISVWVAIVASI